MITEPLVSICCITYNHENFIRDALDGFLMQQTTFPYEILIHDDASTDRTKEIINEYIKKYPDKIVAIFQKENQYSKGKRPYVHFLFPKARGKYLSLCEGDDYWTDKFKLKKQIEFLEEHSEYSLCVGGFISFELETGIKKEIITRIHTVDYNKNGYTFLLSDLRKHWITQTLTATFRKEEVEIEKLKNYKYLRDIHLFYHLLRNGQKGFYFTEILGVSRRHKEGTNYSKSRGWKIQTSYNSYKELYEVNRDNHTRIMCFFNTLALFNYNLFDKYGNKNILQNIKLYFYALTLIKEVNYIRHLFYAFIPEIIKIKLKSIIIIRTRLS